MACASTCGVVSSSAHSSTKRGRRRILDSRRMPSRRHGPDRQAQHICKSFRISAARAVANRLTRELARQFQTRIPALAASRRLWASSAPSAARRSTSARPAEAPQSPEPEPACRPCAQFTNPLPTLTAEHRHFSTPSESSPTAPHTMSAIASTAPTSWK